MPRPLLQPTRNCSAIRISGGPRPGFGRVLAEQSAIVPGEPAEILEAVLHGDVRDRPDVPWRAKRGVDGAEPAVPQEGHGTHAKRLVKDAMQSPARNMQLAADLGNMHGPLTALVEIFLDPTHHLQR